MPLPLHFREYGDGGDTLVLLHGLFGSSANWGSIARALADDYRVLVPDLRNHGRSPHAQGMDYTAMSADLLDLLERHGVKRCLLVGHSMGGKVAMQLALQQPQRVAGLAVVDIAPLSYRHDFHVVLDAMASIDLAGLRDRTQADRALAGAIPEGGVRGFLLQNLARAGSDWHWRINLEAIRKAMSDITGFEPPPGATYPGPAHFIFGERSDYVQPGAEGLIRPMFPRATFCPVAGAGHWVYAEQPEGFMRCLQAFLGMSRN